MLTILVKNEDERKNWAMQLRVLVFEDEPTILRPICTFLRAQGYEVLGFPTPIACSLVSDDDCKCPHDRSCADILITDMKMPKMTGLEMIHLMADKGCYIPPQNKIVISSAITIEQEEELESLGCHFLPKPFQLGDLLDLVRACGKNISPDRELIPTEILEGNR
jgi:DNA-binding response OmpR family regulator